MNKTHLLALSGTSLLALSTPVFAQQAPAALPVAAPATAPDISEIIVSARRKAERLQDVPKSVSVVTGSQLDKLNIRQFQDVQNTVPGLTLQDSGSGFTQKTTLRGVSYDVNAGADATVDFYLDDASIQQTYLFRTLYDISQIEVLRGPQGTLRGRATPSGSITFTTHQPDLEKIGGYVDGTMIGGSIGGNNVQGAINVPIIPGKLAVRLAAQFDDNDGNGVHAAHIPGQDSLSANPFDRTWSERASVRFEPTDTLQINGMYQHMVQHFLSYQQTASMCVLADTTCPTGTSVITPDERLSTLNGYSTFQEVFDIWNGRADWHVLGQKLSVIGMYGVSTFTTDVPMDSGSEYNDLLFGGAAEGSNVQMYTHSRNRYQSQEARLSSEDRILGLFDYTVGLFNINTPTQNTIIYDVNHQLASGVGPVGAALAPLSGLTILNYGSRRETSVYGNLTAHPTSQLEIAAGIRKIVGSGNYSITNGGLAASPRWLPTIWTASATYHFTPDIMAYASAGTSSRQGTTSVGPQSTAVASGTTLGSQILQFANLKAEYSHSYEIGAKTQFNHHQGVFNLTYFHQNFSNFQYANAGSILINNGGTGPAGILVSGMGASVPVKIDGVEGELDYHLTRHLSGGVTFSYVHSQISNGTVACSSGGTLLTDSNGNSIHTCTTNGPASYAPPFTATVQGEYNHEIRQDMTGYLRGQLSIYSATQVNPDIPYNTQSAYALLNAYLGVRDPGSNWDLSVFVKNLTNTRTVLASVSGNTQEVSTFVNTGQPYAAISFTPPRQIGVNLHVAFGAR